MEYLWIVWMVGGVALVIAEVFTAGFVLLWFGVGALVAALLALAGFGPAVQIGAFALVSISLTLASRTIFENALFRGGPGRLKTGMASLPGQVATVVEPSRGAAAEGAVKVFGSTWTALPVEGEEPLREGEQVLVERVDGNTLYVRRPDGPRWR